MKRALVLIGGILVLLLVGAGLFFFLPARLEAVQASPAQLTGQALIERGRYLTVASDCTACHTVKGGQPFAGGLPFKLPFGTIYSTNITPDKETGIGSWSDAEFVRAMRHGVGKDGQNLYPAFPYSSFTKLSTDDILAIRAYLATLEPVHQTAPANTLSFPFNQRWLMRGWNLLFASKGPMAPDPGQSPEWNRGRYLVEAAAHCGECHTPRNFLYGLSETRGYAGETTQGWKAYNISSDTRSGIGAWSVDELAAYLAHGYAAGHGAAGGTMQEAVEMSLSKLTPQDIRAIAVYVKSLPPRSSDVTINRNPPAMAASSAYAPPANERPSGDLGLRVFEGSCASCHGWNGEGLQAPIAALRGSRAANDPEGTNLMQIVLKGIQVRTPEGSTFMPSFAKSHSDAEIAAVSNYVIQHFGGKQGKVTPKMVAEARVAGH